MDTLRYLAYCGYAIVVGCTIGTVWFIVVVLMSPDSESPVALGGFFSALGGYLSVMVLCLVDSFMFAWFPALLFGALLRFVMFRFGLTKFWQWALAGAGMAWPLFVVGGWIAKTKVFFVFSFGLALLRNSSTKTWPAAICGAIVALLLRPLAIRWTNPLAVEKQPA